MTPRQHAILRMMSLVRQHPRGSVETADARTSMDDARAALVLAMHDPDYPRCKGDPAPDPEGAWIDPSSGYCLTPGVLACCPGAVPVAEVLAALRSPR